jgi:hypothetical protein
MTRRIWLFVLLIAVLLPVAALAAESGDTITCNSVQIQHGIPQGAVVGEKAVITFSLSNSGTDAKSVSIKEGLSTEADFDYAVATKTVVSQSGKGVMCFGSNCSSQPVPSFSKFTMDTYTRDWTFTLKPGETKEVSYWVAPRYAGFYWVEPSRITVGGSSCSMPVRSIPVSCVSGHSCDPKKGENAITCPDNCRNWTADNICNDAKDGHCDRDCAAGVDPDCGAAPAETPAFPLIAVLCVVLVVAVAGIVVWYMRKGKKPQA